MPGAEGWVPNITMRILNNNIRRGIINMDADQLSSMLVRTPVDEVREASIQLNVFRSVGDPTSDFTDDRTARVAPGHSGIPANAVVERGEELWALRPAATTTFFGLRCYNDYPTYNSSLAAFGMDRPLTDPAWYPEEQYGELGFANQHATPGAFEPVTRNMLENGLELMITPDDALADALEAEFLSRGRSCERSFNALSKIVSRWMSEALRHATPVVSGGAWRGRHRFITPSDTGGWYAFGAAVEWFIAEAAQDRRLQHITLTPPLVGWAMMRAACMHRYHNVDYMLARTDQDIANDKLRFQVSNSVPSGTPFGNPHGFSVPRRQPGICCPCHRRTLATAR